MLYINLGNNRNGLQVAHYSSDRIRGIGLHHQFYNSYQDAEDDGYDIIEVPAGTDVLRAGMSESSILPETDWEKTEPIYYSGYWGGCVRHGIIGFDDGTVSAIVQLELGTHIWTTSQTGKLLTYGAVESTGKKRSRYYGEAVVFAGLELGSKLCFSKVTGPMSSELVVVYSFEQREVIVERHLTEYPTGPTWRELRLDDVDHWWGQM